MRRREDARREDRRTPVARDRPRAGDRRAHRGRTDQQGDRRAADAVYRTIEGHVYRVCYKLGVADRDELAELISVEPLK